MIIFNNVTPKYLDGTPLVHRDMANNRIGYIFSCNDHGYDEQKIVWLDENGKGHTISGIPGNVSERYRLEAESSHIQPVNDERLAELVREAEQALKDYQEQQKEKRREAEKRAEAFRLEVEKLMPQDTKAVIVAEYMEDESDTMSDYHHSRGTKTLILAWSKHQRDLFPEMRKAALNAEECKHLFDAPPEAEHREKYSMGGGYYLKDGWRHSNGWKIYKHCLFYGRTMPTFEKRLDLVPVGELRLKQEGPTVKREGPAIAGGFEVKDGTRSGFTEIHFADKPAEEVREELKSAGFRWSRANACWYGKTDKLPAKYK